MVSVISITPILMSNLCCKATVNRKEEEKVKVGKLSSIETTFLCFESIGYCCKGLSFNKELKDYFFTEKQIAYG